MNHLRHVLLTVVVCMCLAGCANFAQYEFVGRLAAAAIQSDENVVLQFPPFVWKKIAHFPVDAIEYERSIDVHLSSYKAMLTMDAETFEFSFEELTFQVQLSDGSSRELLPGGAAKAVTVENREEFVQLVVDARLHEIDLQCEAIRYGSVCLRRLERMSCFLTLNFLKMHGIDATSNSAAR